MIAYLGKIYIEAAKDAALKFKGTWVVLFGLVALAVVFMLVARLSAPLGHLGGFIRTVSEAAVLAYYLGWLRECSQVKKIGFSDLKRFDPTLFMSVVGVMFILYIFQWGVLMLTTGMDGQWAFAILSLLCVVLFNSLAETLYLKRIDGLDGIQESFNFTTRNWIEWYIPFLIVLSPILLSGNVSLPLLLSRTHILFPAMPLIGVPAYLISEQPLLSLPLGIALAHWFMLFRAKLYQELDLGTRRQRMFKSRM